MKYMVVWLEISQQRADGCLVCGALYLSVLVHRTVPRVPRVAASTKLRLSASGSLYVVYRVLSRSVKLSLEIAIREYYMYVYVA